MKKSISVLCALVLLMAYCAAMSSLFSVLSIVEGMENIQPGLGVWMPCLALCHLGLSIFLRRERSIRSVIVFCAVFFVLQTVLVFAIYGFFSSFVGVLAAICMWLFSYLCCYEFSIKQPSPEKLTKGFDLCGILLVFLLFFCSVKDYSFSLALPLLVNTVLLLFALVLIRGGEGRRGRSTLISGMLLAAFAAVAVAVVSLASGGIKALMLFLRDALFAVIRFVFSAIGLLFEFLISLFPEKEYELLPPELEESLNSGAAGDMSFALIDPQIILIVIIGIGLAIAAVLLVISLVRGKKLIAGGSVGGESSLRRRRTGLGKAILTALQRLGAALRFRYLCFTLRNTAPGLLIQIENRSRARLGGREAGESCREFLMRAASVYPHAQDELELLADAMDSHCFGSRDKLATEDIIKLRRMIFASSEE